MDAHFSFRLESAMKKRGLTQEGLAAELGITHSAVSRWMSGSLPRAARLTLLAQVLGVSVRYLEGGEDLPESAGYTLKDDTPVYGSKPHAMRDRTLLNARLRTERYGEAAAQVLEETLMDLRDMLEILAASGPDLSPAMIDAAKARIDAFVAELRKQRAADKVFHPPL